MSPFCGLLRPLAIVLFVLSYASASYAQATTAFTRDQAVDADGSIKIGWFLESEFQPYFLDCSQGSPIKKGSKTVSAVPAPILNVLGPKVGEWVTSPRDYTVANAFAVITSSKNLPNVIDPRSALAMDALQDPVTMLPVGVSRVIYSSNCTAILGAAVGADAGVSFPWVKVSSLVRADYMNTSNGELGLIAGVFNSPFLQLYNELQGHDSAVYAHFVLWNWYRNKYATAASMPAENLYALSWFSGISLYRVNKSARETDGSIKLSTAASFLGFASVSGTLAEQYRNFAATDVRNYKFGIMKGVEGTSYQFTQLDAVDQISSWAGTNVFASLDSAHFATNNVIRQGTEETHRQVINGVPPALCNQNLWTITPSSLPGVGALRITGATAQNVAGALPSCALQVSFAADDTLFAGPSFGTVDLKYSLVTNIADKSLQIAAAQVPLQMSSLPQLISSSIGPVAFGAPTSTALGYVLGWQLRAFVLDDPSNGLDTNTPVGVVSGPTLGGCSSSPGTIGIPPNGITLNTSHELTINVQQHILTATKPDAAAATNVTCDVGLKLRFRTANGQSVDRALPSGIRIVYPAVAPLPAYVIRPTGMEWLSPG